jgi:hypothetical protein
MKDVTDPAADRDPIDRPDLAALAGLLADGTRAAMCLALLDGRASTPTELAHHTAVAPSTATAHLWRARSARPSSTTPSTGAGCSAEARPAS